MAAFKKHVTGTGLAWITGSCLFRLNSWPAELNFPGKFDLEFCSEIVYSSIQYKGPTVCSIAVTFYQFASGKLFINF